jgi:hypothetical protein
VLLELDLVTVLYANARTSACEQSQGFTIDAYIAIHEGHCVIEAMFSASPCKGYHLPGR